MFQNQNGFISSLMKTIWDKLRLLSSVDNSKLNTRRNTHCTSVPTLSGHAAADTCLAPSLNISVDAVGSCLENGKFVIVVKKIE